MDVDFWDKTTIASNTCVICGKELIKSKGRPMCGECMEEHNCGPSCTSCPLGKYPVCVIKAPKGV